MIIVQIVLGLLGIGAFLWLLVGMPIGGVWLLIHLLRGNPKKPLPIKRWMLLTFGGMGLLAVVFLGYTVLFLIRVFLPANYHSDPFPVITSESFNPQSLGADCRLDRSCNGLIGIDCNQAADGPYYYIAEQSKEVVATCGGALMAPGGPVEQCAQLHDKLQACN